MPVASQKAGVIRRNRVIHPGFQHLKGAGGQLPPGRLVGPELHPGTGHAAGGQEKLGQEGPVLAGDDLLPGGGL